MIRVCLLVLISLMTHDASASIVGSYLLSRGIFETKSIPYLPHRGTGAFDSYVTIELPYAPAKALRESVEKQTGVTLKNRGEAHITVITPPEYFETLRQYLMIEELDRMAISVSLQSARFMPVCLGRASATLNDNRESTYYVVLHAPEIVRFRLSVFKSFIKRGGDGSRFDPFAFYPHITLGFTSRDLHETDGVKKGHNSCVAGIRLTK